MDKLIDIPIDYWPKLRDMYLQNWPENISAYYTIDNYIKWFEKRGFLNHFHIYSLNNDWNDGTCVIIVNHHFYLKEI